MNYDKKVLYTVSASLLGIILLTCLVSKIEFFDFLVAAVSAVCAVAVCLIIKKRSAVALPYRQVIGLMGIIALVQVSLYYVTGLIFGFYNLSIEPLYSLRHLVSFGVVIVCGEIVRRVLLSQKNKLTNVISYVLLVTLDILMLSDFEGMRTFDHVMEFVGIVLFPALTANLLYHYISSRYGMFPNIAYKLIISLYPYFIPVRSGLPESLRSFAKLVLPLLIYLFIHALYERNKASVISRRKRRVSFCITALILVLMTLYVMLISCHFRFGMLIVGSESMTGSIDKGDAVVYEQYDDQDIEKGQVLVFDKDGTVTIHRVIDIKNINGQVQYYTKGDANDGADFGYITTDDIIGVVNLKIKYFGYPTLWFRELFA